MFGPGEAEASLSSRVTFFSDFFILTCGSHSPPWGRAEDSVCATDARVIVLSPVSI